MYLMGLDPFFRFLSTPSARRATLVYRYPMNHLFISIHALREEGDFRPVFAIG